MRSLASLNSPALITAAGVAALIVLPFLEGGDPSIGVLKFLNLLAFVVNVVSVSIPGRIDGLVAAEMSRVGDRGVLPEYAPIGDVGAAPPSVGESTGLVGEGSSGEGSAAILTPARGSTYLAPAGWAFMIWAPIYLGEAVFVLCQLFASKGKPFGSAVGAVSAPFIVANIFQSLWCASFRTKYMDGGWTKWVNPAMLAGTVLCLNSAHKTYAGPTAVESGITRWEYVFGFLPMSLHFGWTTAATLVSFNASICWDGQTPSSSLAWGGFVSVVVATFFGLAISITRSAPVYGCTIAWALLACAGGMSKRIEQIALSADPPSEVEEKEAYATWQRRLCRVGGVACFVTAVVVLVLDPGLATSPSDA